MSYIIRTQHTVGSTALFTKFILYRPHPKIEMRKLLREEASAFEYILQYSLPLAMSSGSSLIGDKDTI